MLPNFLVVGCQKCATTSLHYYLRQHPNIYLPEGKETKYFVMDERYELGIESYEKNFENVESEVAIGEVDPDYMYFKNALPRLAKDVDLSNLKLIFILRNPVERAFSHYLMTYRRGFESETFNKALSLEENRIQKDYFSRMHYSYVERGYYIQQIKRFEKYINKSKMHFILTDELKVNREKVLKDCFSFLEVDTSFGGYEKKKNYHKGQIPRSEFLLNSIVNKNDSLIKKIIRIVLPNDKFRKKIRSKVLSLNEKDNNMVIDQKTKESLIDRFKKPNNELQDYIDKNLEHWNR